MDYGFFTAGTPYAANTSKNVLFLSQAVSLRFWVQAAGTLSASRHFLRPCCLAGLLGLSAAGLRHASCNALAAAELFSWLAAAAALTCCLGPVFFLDAAGLLEDAVSA